MKAVFRQHPFAGGKIIGRLETIDGTVVLTGSPPEYVVKCFDHGLTITGKRLTLADGDEFIRAAALETDRIEIIDENTDQAEELEEAVMTTEDTMKWEDPDALLRMKLGREEYLQRLLTSLILGSRYPRWNTRNLPSASGEGFLRDFYRQAYGMELKGPLEFVDELELLDGDGDGPNGAPDYAVFSAGKLWIIELKTEAGSHRDDQLPLYSRLARALFPSLQVSITYLTGPMKRLGAESLVEVSFRHLFWDDVANLIVHRWDKSSFKEEQLLEQAAIRVIQGLDTPAQAFRQDSEVIREALDKAVSVQQTGEQAFINAEPGGLQELHDLRIRIRDALSRSENTQNVRPWIWRALTSGGSPGTLLGEREGYEIRLSRYQRPLE